MSKVLVGIGEAGRLIGRTPTTIRIWEKIGLIQPYRATGGTRIYSQDDIERLKEIAVSMENKRYLSQHSRRSDGMA
jgi:DNA-binding transcriptional MerR regulator